ERADAVLVQRPRDAFVALLLAVDGVVFPADFRFAHIENEIVGRLPDLAEGGPNVFDGALIDRIVREVQLRRAHPLADDLHQLFDLRRRERQLRDGRRGVRQIAAPVSSATIATSLSPRPLRLIRIRSFEVHRLLITHAIACALSSAGRIPSSRERAANASSASRSVTASYNTRALSFR